MNLRDYLSEQLKQVDAELDRLTPSENTPPQTHSPRHALQPLRGRQANPAHSLHGSRAGRVSQA